MVEGVGPGGERLSSEVTTQELVLALLQLHVKFNISKSVMDTFLRLISRIIPGVHFVPPSVHMLRRIARAQNHMEFLVHVCAAPDCDGHVYPDLTRDKWHQHLGEQCPKCGASRFKVSRIGLFTRKEFQQERGFTWDLKHAESIYRGKTTMESTSGCWM